MVVPKAGREAVLTKLHEGHPRMARLKRLACGSLEFIRTLNCPRMF